jgi:hypothetical protein
LHVTLQLAPEQTATSFGGIVPQAAQPPPQQIPPAHAVPSAT